MSQREIGPRVGNTYSNRPQDEVDIQAFIERTPQTNEQVAREKANSTWEYSVWMVVIIAVVIILLILVLWFLFKKDEANEVQKQCIPHPRMQHQQQTQPQQQQSQQQLQQPKPENDEMQDEKLAQAARDSLTKKKVSKKEIGPVPGILPDNPSVVGVKEHASVEQSRPSIEQPQSSTQQSPTTQTVPSTQQSQPSTQQSPTIQTVPDTLPDIQSTAVLNRLVANFNLPIDS